MPSLLSSADETGTIFGAYAMSENNTLSPAYVAYSTFKNTILGLAPNGELPTHVDHSVLSTMSGSSRGQFIGALRFFGLVSEDDIPSPELSQLAVSNEQDWKSTLRTLLESHYTEQQLAALRSGTPKSLHETFSGAPPSLIKPATRFFVKAALDVGLSVGPHVARKSAPRSNGNALTRRTPRRQQRRIHPHSRQTQPTTGSLAESLLAKFPEFNPSWEKEQQQSWFEAYQKLLAMTENTKKGGEQ